MYAKRICRIVKTVDRRFFIPKVIAEALGITKGAYLKLTVDGEKIIVEKVMVFNQLQETVDVGQAPTAT
jgi:bifunctional DNA-binding transcriptional regulator/antitoxin component of YhaV-PrlF toxin-antitoxin module